MENAIKLGKHTAFMRFILSIVYRKQMGKLDLAQQAVKRNEEIPRGLSGQSKKVLEIMHEGIAT